MTIKNVKEYEEQDFGEYLKMTAWSYSSIKNAGKPDFVATEKMRLGTLVHNYILEPSKYTFEKHDIVKPIAIEIMKRLGPLYPFLRKELGVTADFIHEGLCLNYKGRVDLCIPNRLIIDIKVTENLNVSYFGYDYQLSGYAIALKCPLALIVAIHPKTKKVEIVNININKIFWEQEVLKKGKVI